jgi:endonuclease/exonuclease/phosphatase family metal-dependent hydrolase
MLMALLLTFNLSASDKTPSMLELKIMSFNFPTTHQNKNIVEELGIKLELLKDGDEKRMKAAKSIIKEYLPHIIGFQETHKGDIEALFESKTIKNVYDSYAPRASTADDDKNALFFNKNLFKVLQKGVLYLNAEQIKGHNSWDDSHQRACTWMQLEHTALSVKLYIYNAHLGLKERSIIEGTKQIADHAQKVITENDNDYAVIMGDFNASSAELSFLTKSPYGFYNLRNITSESEVYGPNFTYTGYNGKSQATPDHIFVTSARITPLSFNTINKKPHHTRPSDHYPLMATVELK